jgi:glycosyltransferase involved in cell wall biosynthesis
VAAARSAGLDVEVLPMPVLRLADMNLRGLATLARSLAFGSRAMLRVLRRERPDLVWVNTVTNPLWTVGARLAGCRVVCHSHEIVGEPGWRRRILHAPLFAAHRVLAVSEACRRDILVAYPALAARVSVVLNPSFSIRGRLPVNNGAENDVVVIGRVSARKGHDVLVEALSRPPLAGLRPVVHVCGDAYKSPRAQAFAATLRQRASQLPADVRFEGYVDTADALRRGGIVVIPSSLPDPCPLVVAEAIVAGRAVVATDVGGIPELVDGAASLVPACDPDALAEALAAVIGDPAERARLERASDERSPALAPERYFGDISELLADLVRELGETARRAAPSDR